MTDRRRDIDERLTSWRERGDPQQLWPHVSAAQRQQAHQSIAAASRAVLSGSAGARLDAHDTQPVQAIGIAAYAAGMGPLLGFWVEQGMLGADAGTASLLALHLEHGKRRAVMLGTALDRVLEACQAWRVTPTVLKGAHTAREYFPHPGTRPSADIDLLVHPRELNTVRAALHDAGYFESRRTERPMRSEWTSRGSSQQVQSLDLEHADNPWSLDLHTALERSYFRGLSGGFGASAFDLSSAYAVDGRAARVLAQPMLTAYLALNASYGIDELRLIRIVELVFVIRRDVGTGVLHWDALTRLFTETGTARFVFPALELTERLVPGTVPAELREWLAQAATGRMRRVVAEADAHGMHLPRRSFEEKLMWARGPAELARNVMDMFLPADSGLSISALKRAYLRRLRRLTGGQVALRSTPPRATRAATEALEP
jgi:hypothetical protein